MNNFLVANSRPLDFNWLRQLPNNLRLEWQEGSGVPFCPLVGKGSLGKC